MGGAKIIRLINNQARMARHSIPRCVVLTRTSAILWSRALGDIHEQLRANSIDVLGTVVMERAAYRDLLAFGETLAGLDPAQVNNVDRAVANAREFAEEVITKLRDVSDTSRQQNAETWASEERRTIWRNSTSNPRNQEN